MESESNQRGDYVNFSSLFNYVAADYITDLPPEILEDILRQISGKDLGRLKKSSKYFNNTLDNPVAWRCIFNERYKNYFHHIKYIDDGNINWHEEVDRIETLNKKMRKSKVHPVSLSSLGYNRELSVHIHKNSIVVSGYAPLDIKSCLKRKSFNFIPKYPNHIRIGPYAGQIEADKLGGHQIVDVLSEEIPFVYKKVFQTEKPSQLLSFSSQLAVLAHNDHISLWNLSVTCKHTEERLWKKSTKSQDCRICAYLGRFDLQTNDLKGVRCSQLDPSVLFVLSSAVLQVRWPIEGRMTEIQFGDACQIEVSTDSLDPYLVAHSPYKSSGTIAGEQKIEVDGELHHVVHCVVDYQHRFYDVTAGTVLAVVDAWHYDKWIPNSGYFAMATITEVIVLNLINKRIVSQFCPYARQAPPRHESERHKTRGKEIPPRITALGATNHTQLLLVAMDGTPVLCSAFTGAQFNFVHLGSFTDFLFTEDETTLIGWTKWSIQFWNLAERAISCLHKSPKHALQ